MIPFDPEKPLVTSGIRIGTPAITTRGFNEQASRAIVHLIDEAIHARNDTAQLATIKEQVLRLCTQHPINIYNNTTVRFQTASL
jgi:glycine hydroxymethyltransferase